jgi:hypothetical protein
VTQAHVLVQVDPGHAAEAARYLREVPDVVDVAQTSGPYDVIATVDASSEPVVQRVLALARRTPGLCALRVCRPAQAEPDPLALRRVPVRGFLTSA